MSIARNDRIGSALKQYRKSNGMTVRQVCEFLNDNYDAAIAEKTVYGWESNQAHPTADMLVILCGLYGITDISCMMAEPTRETITISPEEEALIIAYRKAVPYQPAILALLNPFKPKVWPVYLKKIKKK